MAKGELACGRVDTAASLKSCVDTINPIMLDIGPIDLAIVTGDLTDSGTAEKYWHLRDIMQPLAIPYRAIPGNHDDVGVMRTAFIDQKWIPKTGPIKWIAEFTDLALIGLDTNIAGKAHGHLSDETHD